MVDDRAAKDECVAFEFEDDDDASRVDFEELVASVEDGRSTLGPGMMTIIPAQP